MKSYSHEQMKKLFDASFVMLKEGEIVKATVIKHMEKGVLLNLGLKAEGFLPIEEFPTPEDAAVGKDVFVFLEAYENRDGFPVISKKKADFQLAWDKIKHLYENGELANAVIRKRIKGGFAVDIIGVEAFLPSSQVEFRSQSDVNAVIGQKIRVKIIKINMMRKNIVVSRKRAVEEEQVKLRKEIFKKIKVDDIIEGEVRNITDFGAFIDIGGIDALLHITDISWPKITHPAEVVKLNTKIKVKVLVMDSESGRIAVGLKQLSPHPWEKIEKKYPVGTRIKGKVTSVVDYGAFIEIEKGVEGLVHISEMSWKKDITSPSKILNVGDTVEAVVLSVAREERRISLGMKQTTPDPWSTVDEKFNVGQKVVVKVTNLKDFGAFVKLMDGVEGLIHINDFFWDKKVKKSSDYLKKGQKLEAVIRTIDRKNRRISLSIKHTKEDPFTKFSEKYSEGAKVTGKVSDVLPKGIRLMLEGGIEEFIPANYLAKRGKKPKDLYKLGDEVEVVIRKINPRLRRIILTEKEILRKQVVKKKEVVKPKTTDKFTIGDILGIKNKLKKK
ncbi:30S ribosomal protein S1 [candidate division WOR-3 bacterium]|nr:30S ribosomal protein S1 [candidate division WOR-3 bacterium]MCK4672639.1 30S ribosomal protein S1 [candidate division WOR-3 bacterium]